MFIPKSTQEGVLFWCKIQGVWWETLHVGLLSIPNWHRKTPFFWEIQCRQTDLQGMTTPLSTVSLSKWRVRWVKDVGVHGARGKILGEVSQRMPGNQRRKDGAERVALLQTHPNAWPEKCYSFRTCLQKIVMECGLDEARIWCFLALYWLWMILHDTE